jgi:ABC-type molybdate transport system substrate-binding protein
VIEQFFSADLPKPKLIVRAAIDGGAELVAKGEADIGFYLLSEVKSAKGILVVGLLPPSMQNAVIYGTSIPAYNERPDAALAFVNYLADPSMAESWRAAGFELVDQ